MSSIPKKRERCRNFTEEEKETLLVLVEQFIGLIENKKTDGVTTKQKNNAWEQVAQSFNSQFKTGSRTGAQLKLLYESLKKKAKKHKADNKVEAYKTGGGTYKTQLTNTDNKLIAMLGPQLTSLENAYDSNAEIDDIVFSSNDDLESNVESPASTIALETVVVPVEPATETFKTTFMNRIKSMKNKQKTRTNLEEEDKVNKSNLFMLKKEIHDKKLEILEIIKEKELIDLKSKELDLKLKEKSLELLL
ncbi:hypothetical protein CBL_21033 [Carabus blaptoides fortunei]